MHSIKYMNINTCILKNKTCKQSYLPNILTSLYKFGDKEPCSKSKVHFLIVKKMKIQIFLSFFTRRVCQSSFDCEDNKKSNISLQFFLN